MQTRGGNVEISSSGAPVAHMGRLGLVLSEAHLSPCFVDVQGVNEQMKILQPSPPVKQINLKNSNRGFNCEGVCNILHVSSTHKMWLWLFIYFLQKDFDLWSNREVTFSIVLEYFPFFKKKIYFMERHIFTDRRDRERSYIHLFIPQISGRGFVCYAIAPTSRIFFILLNQFLLVFSGVFRNSLQSLEICEKGRIRTYFSPPDLVLVNVCQCGCYWQFSSLLKYPSLGGKLIPSINYIITDVLCV